AVRLRQLEDELHDVQPALNSARQELDVCRDEMAKLQASYTACQASLAEAREEADRLKQVIHDKEDSNQDEDEAKGDGEEDSVEAQRRQWVDEVAGATTTNRDHHHLSRPVSPMLPIPRSYSSDLLGLGISGGPGKSRRCHTPGSLADNNTFADIMSPSPLPSSSRRLAVHTGSNIRTREPSYAGSGPPPTPFSPFEPPGGEPGQFPHPHAYPATADRENGISAAASTGLPLDPIPSSPRPTLLAQDMISVSTVAAGPSVQLVERMSSAIRRLEAEKVTAKEDMARVCAQRDEARADLVALMKDIADTKATAARVPLLEREVAGLDARYQTTLEMLGEKSELVEELRADVEDVKAMYRELVERTVK
ncbi:hypothetical protein E4U55_004467, partial [Claviceps digitariae]